MSAGLTVSRTFCERSSARRPFRAGVRRASFREYKVTSEGADETAGPREYSAIKVFAGSTHSSLSYGYGQASAIGSANS